jgi:hypothetical protein
MLSVGTDYQKLVLWWFEVCCLQKGDLHVGAVQWAAATAAAADLVYTKELRYETASPLLCRSFVRRGQSSSRNEMSPLFIFFST